MNPLELMLSIGGVLIALGMLLAYMFEKNAAKHRPLPKETPVAAPSIRRRH